MCGYVAMCGRDRIVCEYVPAHAPLHSNLGLRGCQLQFQRGAQVSLE